ncbi:MAG: PhoH family protein [Clostridia bacterium]|nr:PhoH family protein [Clostridia bacterium]
MILTIPETADSSAAASVFGSFDANLKILEKNYGVTVSNRDGEIKISGDEIPARKCAEVLRGLFNFADTGEVIDEQKVRYFMSMDGTVDDAVSLGSDILCLTARGKPLKPKTVGQKKYIESIEKNTVVLGVGPAGTGKTYLAVAMAVKAFRSREVSRIILTRPAVEAGEKLGFLPGDLQNKVDPYLRPLYDALYEMLGTENYQKYVERGSIEIAPLAYMRGRTLDDSFIILDEAQNTTPEQMKMFLTRIGFGSKAVITGDITQIDLPSGVRSGLKEAMKVLENIEGIGINNFSERDVVRHPLVMKIIKAYEKYESGKDRKRR